MNNTTFTNKSVESLQELNDRYADALVPFVIVLFIVALIGIIGNIIVLIVFSVSKEYKFTNFKIFVLCLALLYLLKSVIMVPAEILQTRHYFYYPSAAPCKMKCFLNTFFGVSVALTLLTIGVERFRKICQPLKGQISQGFSLKLCVFVILAAAAVAIPAPVLCGVLEVQKPNIYGTHTIVNLCTADKKFMKSPLPKIYRLSLATLLSSISVVLIVIYVLIGRIVYRQMGVKQTMGILNTETNRVVDDYDRIEDATHTEDDVPVNGDANSLSDTTRKEESLPIYNTKHVQNAPNICKQVDIQNSSLSLNSDSNQARIKRFPYKTLIWLIVTLFFIVTYFLYAILSFSKPEKFLMSPEKLLSFTFLFRLYLVNSIINPVLYALLDQRFRKSLKELFKRIKNKLTCSSGRDY